MKPADYAWSGVAAGVVGYELAAGRRDWELLSEACDRYRRRHPFITNIAILAVALHLMRAIPARIDPLHQLAERLK